MENKCEFCGATLETCGSWVHCPKSFDLVCMTCHWKCKYRREAGSMTWCALAYGEKTGEKEKGAQTLQAV